MLVLMRKEQETIHVGNGIVITVVETRRNCVRLGIDAPKDVKIWRGDLVDRCPTLDPDYKPPAPDGP